MTSPEFLFEHIIFPNGQHNIMISSGMPHILSKGTLKSTCLINWSLSYNWSCVLLLCFNENLQPPATNPLRVRVSVNNLKG